MDYTRHGSPGRGESHTSLSASANVFARMQARLPDVSPPELRAIKSVVVAEIFFTEFDRGLREIIYDCRRSVPKKRNFAIKKRWIADEILDRVFLCNLALRAQPSRSEGTGRRRDSCGEDDLGVK